MEAAANTSANGCGHDLFWSGLALFRRRWAGRSFVDHAPLEAACLDLSAVVIEVSVVLASSNRSSSSRIRRVSSSGNLGSVRPICGTGGAGSKPKTSAASRMAFSRGRSDTARGQRVPADAGKDYSGERKPTSSFKASKALAAAAVPASTESANSAEMKIFMTVPSLGNGAMPLRCVDHGRVLRVTVCRG